MSIEKDYSTRADRKDEHIKMFMETSAAHYNGFDDVFLENNALPEIDFEAISTKCTFLNKVIDLPIMINAVTGGTEYTLEINKSLAVLSKEYNIPMAVGSQTIAIQNDLASEGFRIVREINKDGIIIANVSANSSCQSVEKAIAMIDADAVQLHLNIAQEICMSEGDRHFKGILQNIKTIVQNMAVPVIVKEVGFGISHETAKRLYQAGVKYIDNGGKGGTNFIDIEDRRNEENDYSFLKHWGIPTALSLLECRHASKELKLICSGGITKAEDIVKALAMGANIAGISGFLLRILLSQGIDGARSSIEKLHHQMKIFMLLLGAENIEKLSKTQYLLKGELYQLYKQKFITV